ncbi:MAG: ATP-binding protein [Firmicutes bacterium]|nr:ATP-binding protein [Bacillota bacterium]MDY5586204.1 ATP-binding protein [Eubacteriales bacterium]
MELKSITINGYRNVYNTTINFADLTSILSLNNYGKSNLLTSIVFGLSFMQQHPKNKQNMMNDIKCIPNLKNNNNDFFSFELECITNVNDINYFILYSYSFKWMSYKKQLDGKIISECLKIRDESQTATTFIKREGNNALYKPSKTGRCSTKILIDDNELVINKLIAFDSLYYKELIKELLNINVYIDRHFDSNSGYGITFMSEQELTDLTLKPELNIPKTLYRIKENHPDKYRFLINAFTSLFPSIRNLYVEEISNKLIPQIQIKSNNDIQAFSDKYYLLFVDEKNLNASINFMAMSDGARRVLLLLTFVILAQINNYDLICIEEPENSIHPGLLRKFLFTISELSEKTKLLFSSHSPYLINYMQPENIYLGLPNDRGIAEFKRLRTNTNAKKKLLKDVLDSNMQLGDYLFDLMSGSEDDIEELISYVE